MALFKCRKSKFVYHCGYDDFVLESQDDYPRTQLPNVPEGDADSDDADTIPETQLEPDTIPETQLDPDTIPETQLPNV